MTAKMIAAHGCICTDQRCAEAWNGMVVALREIDRVASSPRRLVNAKLDAVMYEARQALALADRVTGGGK